MAPKKPLAPLDHSKEKLADPRDPRSCSKSWPCYGKHESWEEKSNGYAQWKTCEVCALRLSYVPRLGYHGKNAVSSDPSTVTKAMDMLKKDLTPLQKLPNKKLVETAIEVMETMDRISNHKIQLKAMELHQLSLQQSYLALMNGDPVPSKSSPSSEVEVFGAL